MTRTTPNATAETIRYGLAPTSLGIMLVAASTRGIAAILIGDDSATLGRELRRSLPDTALVEDSGAVAEAIGTITAWLTAPCRPLDLPLDLRGSDQELAVWQALRAIPAGETRSYGALARTLAVPATAQEVGAACAANRIAVAIPCHRVIKADGGISGYRWGVQRKRRLLALEAAA
ncbi:methylated-DNA--[protein]-cysteine S-methyltransferase [Sphingomonas alpina]|uniref:Methylated-DNA--[protein]-cysteine S-methyltransferase n=1 Tax=Sphingomonas alpina TaxID=653931 RepID=A0A7H0LFM5_9SPHN|nr:methylated-DNA--[protein]-cysteine S-methyltransferase [Sphingomonas alpina]QNQ08478.1 methylated-DNA--[protein]-cysteine S-methyltransferase [Sphingomonas alpina]